jgi:hypothetical protein
LHAVSRDRLDTQTRPFLERTDILSRVMRLSPGSTGRQACTAIPSGHPSRRRLPKPQSGFGLRLGKR